MIYFKKAQVLFDKGINKKFLIVSIYYLKMNYKKYTRYNAFGWKLLLLSPEHGG